MPDSRALGNSSSSVERGLEAIPDEPVSVLRAGLRGEATGFARALHADVVSVAKRDLEPGDVLDGGEKIGLDAVEVQDDELIQAQAGFADRLGIDTQAHVLI